MVEWSWKYGKVEYCIVGKYNREERCELEGILKLSKGCGLKEIFNFTTCLNSTTPIASLLWILSTPKCIYNVLAKGTRLAKCSLTNITFLS